MQGRREEETGAYWIVREDFRRPRIRTAPKERLETDFPTDREATQQMDFFSSLLGAHPGRRRPPSPYRSLKFQQVSCKVKKQNPVFEC
jgi:hypothetical protein